MSGQNSVVVDTVLLSDKVVVVWILPDDEVVEVVVVVSVSQRRAEIRKLTF